MRAILNVERAQRTGLGHRGTTMGEHLLVHGDGRARGNVGHDGGDGCVRGGGERERGNAVGRNDDELDG